VRDDVDPVDLGDIATRPAVDDVADAVAELTAHPLWPSVRAVGVGCAGPLDASQGTVGPINIPARQDFPLVRAA